MKINSGFLKRVAASVIPMALLSIQPSVSMAQENRSKTPSAQILLPEPSLSKDAGEKSVIPPQAPYGRQQQMQPSAGYRPPVRSRNWFRRSNRRMPHFIKLPPAALPPAGENLNTFWDIQVSNGEAARMVLYDFDFVPGQANLTPRGTRQLARFADMLQRTPHPLIIQPSPEMPTLDEIRRAQILSTLAEMDVYISEDRLLVRIPPTRELDGIEAVGIQAEQLGLSSGPAGAPSGQSGQTPVAIPRQ